MSNSQLEPQRDQLADHEYDGIQEYDNPTPGWWVALFVLTIAFAVVYFLYYHSAQPGRSIYDGYDAAVTADLMAQFKDVGQLNQDEASLLSYAADPKLVGMGRGVFKSNCVTCHGPEGEGLVGPNLTDDYYKNIKKIEDIPMVINGGAANGAMPAWKTRLHPNHVAVVSAYVLSLRGKNLPGRPPEGDKAPEWPKPRAAVTAPASQPAK